MKRNTIVWLFLVAFLLPAFVGSANASVVVCGDEVSESGVYSWPSFSQGRARQFLVNGDVQGLIKELRELLWENSMLWPERYRSVMMDQMQQLSNGQIPLSDFMITKDVSGIRAKQIVFAHTPAELELPADAGHEECQLPTNKAALADMAQYVMLVERSKNELLNASYSETAVAMQALEERFDKYLFEGFPMFPWEALANSWLLTDESIANGPPRNQLVFMHFAAGVVGATGSASKNDIGGSLSLEPIGWVRYSEDYDSWYGVSLLAVFPSDRDPGYGVAFNYNQFKLGVTWHDYDNDEYDDPTIFLGMELYSFVDEKYRKYTSYKDKMHSILANRVRGD